MKYYDVLRYDKDSFGNVCVREIEKVEKKSDCIRYVLFRHNPQLGTTTITSTSEWYRAPTPIEQDCSIGTISEIELVYEEKVPHTGSYFSDPNNLTSMEDAWQLAEYERTLIRNQRSRATEDI